MVKRAVQSKTGGTKKSVTVAKKKTVAAKASTMIKKKAVKKKVVKAKPVVKAKKKAAVKKKVASAKKPVVKKKVATSSVRKRASVVRPSRSVPKPDPVRAKNVFVDDEHIPADYSITNLVLIARDPNWVYSYWNLDHKEVDDLRWRIGEAAQSAVMVLRMYDVALVEFNGSNANHWFDIDVGEGVREWYVNLWVDHITYCAELGLRTQDGTFHPLTRSNFVTTPRRVQSDRNDLIWMDVDEHKEKAPHIYVQASSSSDGSSSGSRVLVPLTVEQIKAYYASLFPLLKIVRMGLKNESSTDLWTLNPDADWVVETSSVEGGTFHEHYRRIWLGASEEMELLGKTFESDRDQDQDKSFAWPMIGASELTSRGASEQHLPRGRGFFFELWTELMVYGRTEPDAHVTHGSKTVPLNPDGTFQFRFALPDETTIPLDFHATSADQIETRTIATSGVRTPTHYRTEMHNPFAPHQDKPA